MVTVAPDMKVDTESATTKRAQEGMLELLLANHPLDCPVCDKGGECPLQDQAFSHGPGESRYVEEKRHFEKPIPISDLVLLDRERCILCDRCTRFADEVAGDPLISFTHRGNATQVLTFPDEPFASYFSGNTVQICPVGALTATPYRFKARPVGHRTGREHVHDVLGRLPHRRAVEPRPARALPRRRLGSGQLELDVRSGPVQLRGRARRRPARRRRSCAARAGLAAVSWDVALTAAAQLVTDALGAGGPASIAVLGGARGTNEDAFAWARLADALDVPHRDAQLADGLPAELLQLPRATIDEAAAASTVVLLGPDLKEELPVLYLRLRHAAQQGKTRLVELGPVATGLTTVRLAQRAASRPALSVPSRLPLPTTRSPTSCAPARSSSSPVGPTSPSRPTPQRPACAPCSTPVPGAKVLPALRRGNVGRERCSSAWPPTTTASTAWGSCPPRPRAASTSSCCSAPTRSPTARTPTSPGGRSPAPGGCSPWTRSSPSPPAPPTSCSPAAAYGEKSGTTTNLEGRVTEVGQKVTAAGTSRPDWMIAAELAERLGHDDVATMLGSVEAVTDAIAASVPAYAAATRRALRTSRDGVLAVPTPDAAAFPEPTAAVPDRISYDYRLVLTRKLYDRAVGTAKSPSLAPLAPTSAAHVNPLDLDRLGIAAGSEIRIIGHARHGGAPRRRRPRRPTRLVAGAVQRAGTVGHRHHRRLGAGHRRAGGAPLMLAIDPLLEGPLLWTPLLIVLLKVLVIFVIGLVGDDVHGLVRAQDHRRHAEPGRARTRPARSASCRRSPTA